VKDKTAGPDRHDCDAGSDSQWCPQSHRPPQHGDSGGDVGQAGEGQDGLRQRTVCNALAVRVAETCRSGHDLHGRSTVARLPRARSQTGRRAQHAGVINADIVAEDLPRIIGGLHSVLPTLATTGDGWRRYVTLILNAMSTATPR